ncbi:hypothetical protein [Paenibacillus thiaminolyticus]|uniref:Uncharacterized protein n=1 Tax=Paenibacillus thiaminolyticus TaxID=49283 RepID=A0A3A3GGM3_PANTH|nr:hypothetical protein [Paenibacillus thiaminolyticus]RJG23364.1 hypothetical protein DQX05_14055 [Paenibacillus thiaminolyticus]
MNEWIAREKASKSSEARTHRTTTTMNRAAELLPRPIKRPEWQPRQMVLTNEGELLLDATCRASGYRLPDGSVAAESGPGKIWSVSSMSCMSRSEENPVSLERTGKSARKAYLAVAKQRRVKPRTMRKAIGKQLRFVARNLRIIAKLAETGNGLTSAVPRV